MDFQSYSYKKLTLAGHHRDQIGHYILVNISVKNRSKNRSKDLVIDSCKTLFVDSDDTRDIWRLDLTQLYVIINVTNFHRITYRV